MRPGTKNKFDNRFPVRKRKFVAPATRTLALVASELAQPVIEHQEVDQARCRNPWYSGSVLGESPPGREEHRPGFTGKECKCLDDGPWTEDLLMSQDEQRALAAGFLYVFRDPGYRARQVEALREEIWRYVQRRGRVYNELMEATMAEIGLFTEGVKRLDEEAVIIEEEWIARYDEYVTALRVGLQSIADTGGRKTQDIIGIRFDTTVCTSAEAAVEKMICSRVPLTEPAFLLFLTEQEGGIQQKFQQIRQCLLYKLAYFRWKALSAEEQAPWHRRASTLPGYSKTCEDVMTKDDPTAQGSKGYTM